VHPPRKPVGSSQVNAASFLILFSGFGSSAAFATTNAAFVSTTVSASTSMDFGSMAIQLCGGLALFLFGMDQMAEGLKSIAGERMKLVLRRLTSNRIMGAFTGAFTTAIIQSSSVTTVLVVGFITAGLMSFSQSIGVIMGSNIGTTITAQIVAFKVTKAALPMITIGFCMLFFSKRSMIRHYGAILMGLGMIFFGMSIMSEGMNPLRTYPPFLDLMTKMANPFYGILMAAGFTALVQSSSATTAIVIVMASQGFITLPTGIALAFGANIGTCVTALLASIGKSREAFRAAMAHVLFNVLGVLIWFAFIDQLAVIVVMLSPSHAELEGAARLSAETPRQIANAHTIFNISNTLLFIWFTPQFARVIEWLVPDKPLQVTAIVEAKFLNEELLETPSIALERVRMEIAHLGEHVEMMLKSIMPAILHGAPEDLAKIASINKRVEVLFQLIIDYLSKVSRLELTELQNREFLKLMDAANSLEDMGDLIKFNLVGLGTSRINERISVSPATEKVLLDHHKKVTRAVSIAIQSVVTNDPAAAKMVIDMEGEIRDISHSAAAHQAQRLVADEPLRMKTYAIEMDIIERLRRVYSYAKRLARTVDSDRGYREAEPA
jgi:phosphate:Na+ symporter